jgi:hypothetical protein
MRDPKRIPKVLAAVGRYWSLYPDLRLGQLLGNFSVGYNTEDDAILRALGMPEDLEPAETFEEKVERITKAYFQDSGVDGDLLPMDWDEVHPGDRESARYTVAFVLRQAGIE